MFKPSLESLHDCADKSRTLLECTIHGSVLSSATAMQDAIARTANMAMFNEAAA